jgi:4-hydroxybenzoate polyprenyltransferase
MILCDLRDIKGDAHTGIRSLPVALGTRGSVAALCALLALTMLLSIIIVMISAPGDVHAWNATTAGTMLYLFGLLFFARDGTKKPEWFYEWWVEGILFVPLLCYCVAR